MDAAADATSHADASSHVGASADIDADAEAAAADPADPGVEAADPDATAAGAARGRSLGAAVAAVTARGSRMLTRHGRRPHLTVTGAATTLAGLDELPGQLDGHGAITAPMLRAIAASFATLTAITLDSATGAATGIGALTYRPRQHLADQVTTLAGTCRTPGCRQPAWRCHLDHLQPFNHQQPAAGGPTTLHNLHPQCAFHHLLKHHSNWTPQLQPDLTISWTTNTGHTATSHPREFTTPGQPPAGHPGQPHPGNAGPPAPPAQRIVTGPVAGPTIPVLPAGAEHHEPHTELEDPDTIPDPGSIAIHPYRALRQQTREHALRRIGKIKKLSDPADPAPAWTVDAPTGQALTDLRATVAANMQAIRNLRGPATAPVRHRPRAPPAQRTPARPHYPRNHRSEHGGLAHRIGYAQGRRPDDSRLPETSPTPS